MQENTRDEILKAAVTLMGDHGLRKLTQPQVAQKAKVRQSHVTYYFPKRSDLVAAVARRYIESAAKDAFDASQRGESLLEVTRAILGDRRRARTLIGLLVASEEDPALRGQIAEAITSTQALIASVLGLEEGHQTAVLLQATLWGLALQHLLLEGRQSEKKLEQLIALAALRSGLPPQGKRKGKAA